MPTDTEQPLPRRSSDFPASASLELPLVERLPRSDFEWIAQLTISGPAGVDESRERHTATRTLFPLSWAEKLSSIS